MAQDIHVGTNLRYPKPAQPEAPFLDGFLNFHWATRDTRAGAKMCLLESGINALAEIKPSGLSSRRPAILIRSSPAKAGTEESPWEDVIDLERGVITYFGDHKPDTEGSLGTTKGNKALERAWPLYSSRHPQSRLMAPPLLVFVTSPWFDRYGDVRHKGVVRFLGPAVLEDFESITAIDNASGASYPNYRTTLRLTNWTTAEVSIDWRWINQRRNPELSADEASAFEPQTWNRWRRSGVVPLGQS